MIPVFDVGEFPPFELEGNGSVPEEAWIDDGSPDPANEEYFGWVDVSGSEFDQLLAWEAQELQRLDFEESTAEGFERAAAAMNEGRDDGDFDWDVTELSAILDFGIVSCVAALHHLGVPTTSSCRGHFGRRDGRDVPYVRFVGDQIDADTWALIQSCAKTSNCHLFACGSGLVELIGSSCADMVGFARGVRETRLS
ncbi:hypothetical protein GCM10009867_21800 [Pedococcus aerophilus]|uniref:Uncharacterized protein n=1 Tax=Pedococcus aerophilus TaxID=436356 RepID=A0ABP6H5J5_9MICO